MVPISSTIIKPRRLWTITRGGERLGYLWKVFAKIFAPPCLPLTGLFVLLSSETPTKTIVK